MLQSQQRLIYLIDINRLNFLDFPLSGGIIHQEKSKEIYMLVTLKKILAEVL